jgi:hypothetical protein
MVLDCTLLYQLAQFKLSLELRRPDVIERRSIGSLLFPLTPWQLVGGTQDDDVLNDPELAPRALFLASLGFAAFLWSGVLWLAVLVWYASVGGALVSIILLVVGAALFPVYRRAFRGPGLRSA